MPSVCVSAEEAHQSLTEWEFTFLTILCNAIYATRKINAVIPSLHVPMTILDDAAHVHGLVSERNALTTHIIFEWWCAARMTLTEKLTRLQCTILSNGLRSVYYSALRSYGHFLCHFSPSTSEHTPPPSPGSPGWLQGECGYKKRPPCGTMCPCKGGSTRNSPKCWRRVQPGLWHF